MNQLHHQRCQQQGPRHRSPARWLACPCLRSFFDCPFKEGLAAGALFPSSWLSTGPPGPLDMEEEEEEEEVATADHSRGGRVALLSDWPGSYFERIPSQGLLMRGTALRAQPAHPWELQKHAHPSLSAC